MANENQLEILGRGVKIWNKWREENPITKIDLSRRILNNFDLQKANFRDALFIKTDFISANLSEADLSGGNFRGADFEKATLINTKLCQVSCFETKFVDANLTGANLAKARLQDAELNDANLQKANLQDTKFFGADLSYANLSEARFDNTDFEDAHLDGVTLTNTDLSGIVDIENCYIFSPPILNLDTIRTFRGKAPRGFLRLCGFSDWEIETEKLYNPDLGYEEIDRILRKIHDLRVSQSVQISPLFISYSHGDIAFVEKLESHLDKLGIRFWRDIHDAKAGRLEKQIERAIRLNPTVLLIVSKNSMKSDWVEHEVRTARGLEKEMGQDVLCPIALDDSWKDSRWPKRVMEQITEYNILDFSAWEDDAKFESMFGKLIDGLQLFYKG